MKFFRIKNKNQIPEVDLKTQPGEVPYHAYTTLPKGKTLVLAPHPDDEVFGCGGAILRHVMQSDPVRVVIVTDGGLPVADTQKFQGYAGTRKRESAEAAKVMGYGEPYFLGFRDGHLNPDNPLTEALLRVFTEFSPQNIYLPSETEIHPDHFAVNKATLIALQNYPYKVNLFFYEVGQPLFPNFFHDITDLQSILEKAMNCFESQNEVQDYERQISALHAYRSYTLGKNVRFAEAYRYICV